MSRIEVASLGSGVVEFSQSGLLRAAEGAAVSLYKHGTSTPVIVYAAETGATALSQPLTSGPGGRVPGWVNSGERLDAEVVFRGVTIKGAVEPIAADAEGAASIPLTQKGKASGVAELDSEGHLPVGELPGSVVDIDTNPVYADVVAPVATGTAATDTANLKAAITATPAGGTLFLNGHYKINETLTREAAICIRGRSMSYTVTTAKSTPTSGPTEIAQINGTIIEQTAVGLDNFDFTGAANSLKIHDVAFLFTAGLASTGHGINCTPAVNVGEGGHEPGVYGGRLDNVLVGGHDGNHYALVRTNVCEFTTTDFRSFGGGGILDVGDSAKYNTGNIVDTHPYIHLYATGTAHGIARNSATSYPEGHGNINLITVIRPQVNIDGAAATTGTQALWKDNVGAGLPARCLILAPDLEAPGHANPIVFGEGTEVIGANTLLGTANQQLENVQYGFRALGSASAAGAKNGTAVGWEALKLATGNANSAFGCLAGQENTTGVSNTAGGYKALQKNKVGEKNAVWGARAGESIEGTGNSIVGFEAISKATGNGHSVLGRNAGEALTTGAETTLVGVKAGKALTTASQSTLVGGESNTTANVGKNAALGYGSLVAEFATALGYKAKAEGKGSVAIGTDGAGTAASTATENAIALGTALHTTTILGNASIGGVGKTLGFYGHAPAAQPAKPEATAAAIITALESIGLFA